MAGILILGLLSSILIILCVVWYIWKFITTRAVSKLPSYPCLPLLGHALHFMNRKKILDELNKMSENLGDTALVVLGTKNYIFTWNYDKLETILSSTKYIEKAVFYKNFHNWLSTGLLTSAGPKWKQRRRILTPTYHFQILEQFVPVFDSVSDNLVEKLRYAKDKSSVDIYHYVTLSTLDVICETAMGVQVNALEHDESEYVKSVKTISQIVIDRVTSPIEQNDFLYKFTENYRKEKKCLKILHGHTKSIIEQRRKLLENNKNGGDENDDNDFGRKKRVAFLDLLLQITEKGVLLSDKDIQEEVETFMFGGHDTAASGISFTLFEIAKHSEVQKKILKEQKVIFGDDQRPLTYRDLNNMKYLDLVIKESLRLYPPVPIFARHVHEDFKLDDDLVVPEGFSIFISAYHMHRNPKMFENPNDFIPERFLCEKSASRKPYSFIAFSAGPRNCVGQKFAMLEMKATISKIIRNFELRPSVPQHVLELSLDTILKSDNGIKMQLRERN